MECLAASATDERDEVGGLHPGRSTRLLDWISANESNVEPPETRISLIAFKTPMEVEEDEQRSWASCRETPSFSLPFVGISFKKKLRVVFVLKTSYKINEMLFFLAWHCFC